MMPPERKEPGRTHFPPGSITRQRLRVVSRALSSLLMGAAAILGAVVLFRQGVLPLIDGVFQPGTQWLSAFRRAGILLMAVAPYWAYVRWHEEREAIELRLQPLRLSFAGASGACCFVMMPQPNSGALEADDT
jgi:hypothetical protein